jgi:hypothetical protein
LLVVLSSGAQWNNIIINLLKMTAGNRGYFCTGRWIIGLIAILTGLQTLSQGQALYDQSLNELRKTYLPETLATQPVCSGTKITWEEMNRYAIQAEAGIFILSGLLLVLNRRCTGSLLLVVAVSFIIAVKDLPWLRHSALKTTSKERNDKLTDFLKNLALLGAALLLMADRGTPKATPGEARKEEAKPNTQYQQTKFQQPSGGKKKKN